MTLAERIQLLVDAGFSKSQLAKAAGKTPGAVTQWLTGSTKEIKADTAWGLSALTGYSAEWISTGTGPKERTAAPAQADPPAASKAEPSATAMEIALLYDLIPVSDRVRRTKAYNAATAAILAVLEGQ